jgi:hypothetical protein
MRRISFCWLLPCLITPFLLAQSNPVPLVNRSASGASDPKAQARVLDSYGKLPLSFEANHGQTDSQVKFFSRAGGYSLFLTADEAVIALRGKSKPAAPKGASRVKTIPVSLKRYPDTNPSVAPNSSVASSSDRPAGGVLRMKLLGANPAASVTGVDELAGTSNYFIGNDPAKWRTGVPTYAKVKYAGIYSGIDLLYYGNQRQLEYDFIVAPGADPRRIAFDVRGASRIFRDAHGELVFKVGDGEVRWHRPVVYQEKDGARQVVAARYVVTDGNRIGFAVAKYDPNRPLYIDPLIYSTYLGGDDTVGYGIAVDSAGDAYVTGLTWSTSFPTTLGAFERSNSCDGYCDMAFVTKINPTGSGLVYSTYLGGSEGDGGYGFNFAHGIAVDNAGNAYVTGETSSTDFPTTPGAFQTACNIGNYPGCGSAVVTKISSSGRALVYSTYLGGTGGSSGSGIALDSEYSAYVTGWAGLYFPTTPDAFQTVCGGSCATNAFITKMSPDGSALVYSTYLGGSRNDYSDGIAVDSAGDAYIAGVTDSSDFPTTPGAFQTNLVGPDDAFVAEINPAGSALVYSTYLGGAGDSAGSGIAVDSVGNAYVVGSTGGDFPITPGAFQTTYGGGDANAFVAKINPTGSALAYSTYLGGTLQALGSGIAVDSLGDAYVTGLTGSHFPIVDCLQSHYGGGPIDAFVAIINPAGSELGCSTYLGGSGKDFGYAIALDTAGNAYVTGNTVSNNFPVTPGAFQQSCVVGGQCSGHQGDAFISKMHLTVPTTTTLTSSPNPSSQGQPVTFTAVVASGLGGPPDGETVSFMKGKTVLGTGTLSGGSASFTTSTPKVGTTSVKAVYVGDPNFAGSTSKVVKQVVEKAE